MLEAELFFLASEANQDVSALLDLPCGVRRRFASWKRVQGRLEVERVRSKKTDSAIRFSEDEIIEVWGQNEVLGPPAPESADDEKGPPDGG